MSNVLDIRIKMMQKAIKDKRFRTIQEYEAYKNRLKLTDPEMVQALEVLKVS
jgi:hypothetical protein